MCERIRVTAYPMFNVTDDQMLNVHTRIGWWNIPGIPRHYKKIGQ